MFLASIFLKLSNAVMRAAITHKTPLNVVKSRMIPEVETIETKENLHGVKPKGYNATT
jgi:hypothetical protein